MPKTKKHRSQKNLLISAGGEDLRQMYPKQDPSIKKQQREAKPPRQYHSEPPQPIPGFNLAGRPSEANKLVGGIYQNLKKHAKPIITQDLNTASYWQFKITTSNREWFRFDVDSLSMVLFGKYTNASYDANGTAEARTQKHALKALTQKPPVFFDPSVLATVFIASVDVCINNVPVPTNNNLNNFLSHYARFSRVFTHKAYGTNYVECNDDLKNTDENTLNKYLHYGAKFLDYGTYNATEGKRVPIRLHGIFPFENTCRPRAALINSSNDSLYFPPGTTVDIRINLNPHKEKLLFSSNHVNIDTHYYDTGAATAITGLELSVQDVSLSYETYILDEERHLKSLSEFQQGLSAKYDYDIVYTMHQNIVSNQSYVSNDFQIPPFCAMLCIMFLPDHGVFFTPSLNKPPSAFSRFPSNCTKMKLKFNGVALICDELENPGIANHHNEHSKHVLYEYLTSRRLYSGKFDFFFPNKGPLNQMIVIDMENQKSQSTGILNIETYYNETKSTANNQILIFSIHANGRAEAKLLNKIDFNYEWKFYTLPH